jgi:hypothetical protein
MLPRESYLPSGSSQISQILSLLNALFSELFRKPWLHTGVSLFLAEFEGEVKNYLLAA